MFVFGKSFGETHVEGLVYLCSGGMVHLRKVFVSSVLFVDLLDLLDFLVVLG